MLVIGFMIITGNYSIKTQFCDTLESPFPPLSLCSQKNHQSHQSLPGDTVTKIHPLISNFPGQILSQCWITSYFNYYKWILSSLHISELVKILPIRKTWFFPNCAGPLLFILNPPTLCHCQILCLDNWIKWYRDASKHLEIVTEGIWLPVYS